MQEILLTLMLYPGLLLALALAALFWLLGERQRPAFRFGGSLLSAESLMALAAILLAAIALAALPWPFHPAASVPLVGQPALIWAALEGAFLAPSLPGLLARDPRVVRAASREAQLALGGRLTIWLAIGAGLWGAPTLASLAGRGVLLLAALLAFPAAAGYGPFAEERALGGSDAGLDETSASLLRLARATRAAALLAALLVANIGAANLRPELALAVVGAAFVAYTLLLRQLTAGLPRLTLSGGLRWCVQRALPLGVLGLLLLAALR